MQISPHFGKIESWICFRAEKVKKRSMIFLSFDTTFFLCIQGSGSKF